MKYFTITTNKEVADQIKAYCEWEERCNPTRTYKLGGVMHSVGFSVVQLKAKNGQSIEPSDIFFLGYFSRDFNDVQIKQ